MLEGIRGMVQSAMTGGPQMGRIGKAAGVGNMTPSQKVLRGDVDLGTNGSITCNAEVFTVIGSYTVKPQTKMRAGYGVEGRPQSTVGRLYGSLRYLSNGIAVTSVGSGVVRVSIRDSEQRVKGYTIVNGVEVGRVDRTYTDVNECFWLPENGPVANEDDQIIVEYKPPYATTVRGANTVILMDTTLYS